MPVNRIEDYIARRREEARRIVADAELCAARPGLRRLAWRVLTGDRLLRPEAFRPGDAA